MAKDRVTASLIGARVFYFGMFGLFFAASAFYANPLKEAFSSPLSHMLWLTSYLAIFAASVFLFLTAGQNPGFLKDTMTEEERKAAARALSADAETPAVQEAGPTVNSEFGKITSIQYIAEMEMPNKRWCDYCQVEQPYRTRHCNDCGQCVRKFDHHCFWIGSCVGELNHGKFWFFLAFQTVNFWQSLSIARAGWEAAGSIVDLTAQNHVIAVWASLTVVLLGFLVFTLTLLTYQSFLLASGQTSWEHMRRRTINYMNVYPTGFLPFYETVSANLKAAFSHDGKVRDWKLRPVHELKQVQGFNWFENEHWSCC